ncbi:hypothetical protein AAFF_G00154670 [Aldrovandia affinis]|uniref:Calmin n=1 Tax=Aldrovandia affinis TaxID=143900 RepID=A0AAD7SZW0_9TELE|nr:hypothetical protein AAFF_G00154670 [Aldrovandia affinis]
MAGHEWDDWFEREEFIGQISDIRVQNLQVEREVVQKRTFTRWMNLHLEKCNPPMEVKDLFRDIQDGRVLMALLEELSGCKLLHGFKPSSHRIFRLNNIAKVLAFLEERNVKLVSIDAADVADGNSSIVLGLIWNIILFFQIKELTGNIKSQFPSTSSLSSLPNSSDSDTSHSSTPSDERRPSIAMRDHGKAIKTLLHWVQRRTRKYGVAVQDFGKSWRSGLAFLAVIKSIDTTLVDMRRALLRTSRENLEDAFRTAHYSLGIPRLLEPEDVTINSPDEQSIMTYVSQFLEHFPGFDEEENMKSNALERSKISTRQLDDTPVNGLHRKREKPYVVRKDWVQPPPKIFISSVSEDKEQSSPSPLQNPGDRTGEEESSESISSSAGGPRKRPRDLGKEVSFTVSSSSSPQPSFVDSVIDSPDSWSEITSEAVLPEKLPESRSDGSLNESDLPFDQTDAVSSNWPLEKSIGDQAETGKGTDDQVFTDLFVDEGNFSLSSVESFQTKSKLPSEEEDAYRYILDLNEEEPTEPSSPGNGAQLIETTNGFGSASEQMQQTSVAQDKTETKQTVVPHEVDKHTSLSQNNVKESSPEHSNDPEKHGTLGKMDSRLEGVLEHKDTSTLQNHDVGMQSSPELSQEKHQAKTLTDTHSEEQQDGAGLKKEPIIKQPPPEICVELDQTIPSDFEEQDHTEIPQDSGASEATEAEIQNLLEDKDSSEIEESRTHEILTLDDTCGLNGTVLGSDQSSELIVDALDTSLSEEVNVSMVDSVKSCKLNGSAPCHANPSEEITIAPDKLKETNDDTRNDNTSCERKDGVLGGDEHTNGTEVVTPGDKENLHSPHSSSDPQSCSTEAEPKGTTEQCTEDHAYLSWTERPVSGDGINDAPEEADQKSSSAEPESRPAGLYNTDSVLELKPDPDEERALDSEADSEGSLAENSEDFRQDKGKQEGLSSSQMPRSDKLWKDDAGDSGGTEPDMSRKHCELIKTDEDPAAASENRETLRGQADNDISTSESHFSPTLHLRKVIDSDGLKIESKKINESEKTHNINSDLRGERKSPATSGVTATELYWLLFLWIILYCLFVLPQIDMKTLPQLLLNLEE